jgi:hypothetical protein
MSRRRPRVPGTSSRPRGVLFVLPEIPDEAPERRKNGLAIRNAATTSGVCPDCGARGEIRGPDGQRFLHLVFEHEHGCGVLSDPEAA